MPGSGQYAEVIVNKAVDRVDRVFHYSVPDSLKNKVQVGSVVSVPFGRQELEGVVVGFVAKPDVPAVREVTSLLYDHPLFQEELVDLAAWIADYYLCPKVLAMQAMLPRGLKMAGESVRAKYVDCLYLKKDLNGIERNLRFAPRQKEILSYLSTHNGMPVGEILKATGASRTSVRSLEKKGLVEIASREVYRDPYSGEIFSVPRPQNLTGEQKKALTEIKEEALGKRRPVLLFGVTGSGKTEVYLQVVQQMISKNKQSIVLVPEIALTPQMAAVFKTRWGEQVAVLHSGLSAGERRDAWMRISSGQVRVVVGARSAVFAPCRELGLIVIDEEHEQSYKQENVPRFHAREVAIKRAQLQNALLIMGSATPSVESFYKASTGEFRLITLESRVLNQPLPQVSIVDMRKELKEGNRSIFSSLLREKMAERLLNGEQTLLFLNRRGFHTFVSCRACGYVITCPHCTISLTFHAGQKRLRCHYCGYSRVLPAVCPSCGSHAIRQFGTGTQRVEDEVRKLFPEARVARVDSDTMGPKGSYDRVYRQVRKGEIDIIVGTQMVAKGLDFPGVTLVGVVSADLTLHIPEMRAGERTFQLITQVAGRAGRGEKPGEVVLQTYHPQDPAIMLAARQDYPAFIGMEIENRKASCYPPFGYLIRVLFTCRELPVLERTIDECTRYIREEMPKKAVLLGPAPAPLERIKDRFRMHLVLKGEELLSLRTGLQAGLKKAGEGGAIKKDVNIAIDVEPINMM